MTATKPETKHTPGPWIDRHWDGNQQIIIAAVAFRGPNVLALVRPPLTGIEVGTDNESWECTSRDVDEAGANARLIAAAPDLLAACKDALYACEHAGPQSTYNPLSGAQMQALRDAIEKAS